MRRPLTSFALRPSKSVLEIDAGACPVGTPDCACERVLQDLDLVVGSADGASEVQYRGPSSGDAMDVVHPCVAGIDVHKRQISVAVRLPGEFPGERRQVVRSFKTFWRALRSMADWL